MFACKSTCDEYTAIICVHPYMQACVAVGAPMLVHVLYLNVAAHMHMVHI